MSIKNINSHAEYRRNRANTALCCYFFVEGRKSCEENHQVKPSIERFMRLFDVNEDDTSLDWLQSEYHRYKRVDLKGFKHYEDERGRVYGDNVTIA